MHEILVDTIGDLTISAYIKEKVLWDIEIDNPNFPLQPTGIYEFKVTHVDKNLGISFLNSSPHQAITNSVKNLSTGDIVRGKVTKYFPETDKLPEVEITDAPCCDPTPSFELLMHKYGAFSPKLIKEDGILEVRDYISEILALKNKEIPLPNGAILTIEPTKALISIDIDTKNADGVMKTNLLATREIARQIFLRKLGGMIVIDFLRLKDKKHRDDLENKFKGYFKNDDSRIDFYGFSASGLYELSRERTQIPTSLHLSAI